MDVLGPGSTPDLDLLDSQIRCDLRSKAAVWDTCWSILFRCPDGLARRIFGLEKFSSQSLTQAYVSAVQRLVGDGMLGVARLVIEWHRSQAKDWGLYQEPLPSGLVRLTSGSV